MEKSNDKKINNHDKTISVLIPIDRLAAAHRPYLVRLIDCDRPFVPSSRHWLDQLAEVTLGRASVNGWERRGNKLRLTTTDPRMSGQHAQLRDVDGWSLEDAGSRNGTFVNGKRIDRPYRVKDGDLIELGYTFYLFRSYAVPLPKDDDPLDHDASPLDNGQPPGLSTLSPTYAVALSRLKDIAPSSISVILYGDTGTGKEVLANAIHVLSRRPGRIAALNCGAIPIHLLEAELFGARKGAFTGAIDDRKGMIREADGGTLFLDEIGELPLSSQVAFLRVLQERAVLPVGGTRPVLVDFRLCAATHRNLDALVDNGQFRPDLLARLTGFTLRLPPLRERREDLGLLIASLLRRSAGERADAVRFTRDAMRALLTYSWPLNIRELAKALEPALVLARDQPIDLDHLPEALQQPQPQSDPVTGDDEEEDTPLRAELRKLLEDNDGNLSAVARFMGKDRVQIRRWLRKYKLDPAIFRKNGKNKKKSDDDDDNGND